jgi:hypothetical protein
MSQYIRQRRPWAWLTTREVEHLPFFERERLRELARQEVYNDWLCRCIRVLTGLAGLATLGILICGPKVVWPADPVGLPSPLVCSMFSLLALGWLRERNVFRRAMRAQLLAQGVCPAYCFECGYFTEGFQGSECPSCGAALIASSTGPP